MAKTSCVAASGTSFDNCAYVVIRYDEPTEREDDGELDLDTITSIESYVGLNKPEPNGTSIGFVHPRSSRFTGIHRTPNGRVYLGDARGMLHVNADPTAEGQGKDWVYYNIQTAVHGVWGLDDNNVYVWGAGRAMVHFTNGGLSDAPAPSFKVRALHGARPDFLCAVGADGAHAFWDGTKWSEWTPENGADLVSVFVASPEEVYALDARGGLFQLRAGERVPLAESQGVKLHAVCKWKGHIYIAAGDDGLFRFDDGQEKLELVRPTLHAIAFDARDNLVVTCTDRIAGSSNGERWQATPSQAFEAFRAGRAIGDFTEA